MLVIPLPNKKAVTVVYAETPDSCPMGPIMGILTAACPEVDGIKKTNNN